MIMKIGKVLWVVATLCVLFVTLYAFDGDPNSDIWIFLTWLMLIFSFPAGLLASLLYSVLGVNFSYLSLALMWGGYFIIGYLQWFKLVPYLVGKLRALKTQRSAASAKQ